MTNTGPVRQAVANALRGSPTSLASAAATLLNALGYKSDRTDDAGTVGEFLERQEAASKLTEKHLALFESWRDVELVFQVTDEEVRGTASLLAEAGFDQGRIHSFLFIAAELVDDAYSRTKLAEMTRAVNRLFPMPVVLLFRCGERFSLAVVHRRAHRRDDSRDVLERVTLVRDVDVHDPHRAHLDILADLALPSLIDSKSVSSFDDLHRAWEGVLDTEELNRRFYRELFGWFKRALTVCKFPDDGEGPGSRERQVIRLITRLLFIWFLKEKGLVPDELFTEAFASKALKRHAPETTDYYRAVLQNLFFATLNREIDKRSFRKPGQQYRDFTKYRYADMLTDPPSFLAKLKSVPFVNGGLFDCLDDFEGVKKRGRRIDAFTDNQHQGKVLQVPASIFLDSEHGLFALFRRFKFTVEENTPLDQEVALDPELLGRVFENLLAAYNPETRNTVRKATGSYYTPRRIVDYMVEEALVAALLERVKPADGDAKSFGERLSYLFDYAHAFDDAAEFFDENEKESLVRAIAHLRVLDPAVGSGAFPMGALHKLTLALRRLDPRNELWKRFQKERAATRAAAAFEVHNQEQREAELRDISQTFENYRDSDYGRKLYLIQNGIFGVDLQPVACQIARLRFFISLTVEQQRSDDASSNYGIRPLPNLETRIVAANTLIGIAAPRQMGLGDDKIQRHMGELARIREQHFNAGTRRKKRGLREQDAAVRKELARTLKEDGWGRGEAQSVADWDLYNQNAAADWFDPRLMFGVKEFDVVIANPPYVRADFQDAKHKATRQAIKKSAGYDTLWEKWDLFLPFMERGFKLLREGGVASFIVSDAFGHAKYALKAREWFLRHARILRLDFYGQLKLFDAAVHNISYVFQRLAPGENEPMRRLHEAEFGDVALLSTARQSELTERAFVPSNVPARPVSPAVPLSDVCYVSYGLRANADDRFAKGAFRTGDVVSIVKDDLHPLAFVQGKHIAAWRPLSNVWLEWGSSRAPADFARRTFDELYDVDEKIIAQRTPGPDPKSCLDEKRRRFDASCVGFVRWADLREVRNRSIRKQARYPGEKRRSRFRHREELEKTSERFHIKYILGVMNSRSASEFLMANRRSNVHLYPDDWKKLPIPNVPKREQQAVVRLVARILDALAKDPDADVVNIENQIDEAVHRHYGFG